MRLIFPTLAFSTSLVLATLGAQAKAIAKCGNRDGHPASHHGDLADHGQENHRSKNDLSSSHDSTMQSQKIVGRTLVGRVADSNNEGRYIYEDPRSICSWCECPTVAWSNHPCPFDSTGANCPKCSKECLGCSCAARPSQLDYCSTKCAKKCVEQDSCKDCSCSPRASQASSSSRLCEPACRKCPVGGSNQPNQRCDLCPFSPCVDNLCPCFEWCRTGECNIYTENDKKDIDACVGDIDLLCEESAPLKFDVIVEGNRWHLQWC